MYRCASPHTYVLYRQQLTDAAGYDHTIRFAQPLLPLSYR